MKCGNCGALLMTSDPGCPTCGRPTAGPAKGKEDTFSFAVRITIVIIGLVMLAKALAEG